MTADSGLIFIAITPCRAVDTRYPGGAFGTPSLVANTPRIFPVPASNCGVPVAAAYSMNFVSITPAGQAVGFVAAWQDDRPWPGTVVLNALQGGIVDNSAIVPAGADGGIQVMATANCDLVIDLNAITCRLGIFRDLRGRRVLRDRKGRPVQRARKDRLERWERLGRRELKGPWEPKGLRGRRGLWGRWERKDCPGRQEPAGRRGACGI